MNQTLVLIKPDGLKKSLTGNVLTRLSETKLDIIGAKIVCVSRQLAEEHYRELKDKPFFNELIKYLMGHYHKKKVMALVYGGDDAIKKVRKICGATNPEEADMVSIRGQFGRITTKGVYENIIHASASPEEVRNTPPGQNPVQRKCLKNRRSAPCHVISHRIAAIVGS